MTESKADLFAILSELNKIIGQFEIMPDIAQKQGQSKLLEFMGLKDNAINEIEKILKINPDVLNFEIGLKEDFSKMLSEAKYVPTLEGEKIILGPKCYEFALKFKDYSKKIDEKAFEGASFD